MQDFIPESLPRSGSSSRPKAGFSLIEMLVVLAIVGILSSIAIPAALSVQRSMNINRAGQLVQAKFKYARQMAVTRNRAVEVRFFATPSKAGAGKVYNALQLYIYDDKGLTATPLDKLTFLPDTIALTTQSGYSTILDSPTQTGTQTLPNLGGSGYDYKGFRFKNGGSTDLAALDASNNALLWS